MNNTQKPARFMVYRSTKLGIHNILPTVKSVRPVKNINLNRYTIQPLSDSTLNTSREVDVIMNDLQETSKRRRKRLRVSMLLILLVLLIMAIIAVPITISLLYQPQVSTITNTITTTVMTISTTLITITSAAGNCTPPYVRASSGNCVNVLMDFNNCGTVDHVCPSYYTSCSAGVCSTAPAVQLANPNSIWTAAVNGSVDDNYYGVAIPFNITLYTTTTDFVYVTTNGVLCLGSCSAIYTETTLPTSAFPGASVLPYWDDLYIYSGTSQGIYYASEGNAPNRTLIFEFYMSHFNQPTQYYHFQVIFFESLPGVVQYKYYDASDGGVTCTVGVQASGSGPFIQYSFDLANSVHSNMSLAFDTNLGTYTNSTF